MANADMKVEVAAAMKSYLTSQDFKDIIAKVVKEAVGQAVESILKEMKTEIAVLEERVKTLEDTIEKVAAKANDNEQFSRRQNVRVTGFVEEEEENCAQKFVNLCREKIGLDVNDDIVDRAHRVGKKEEGANRAIIVRLKTHKDKLTILRNRKNLKGSGFYINEDLTKFNQKLLYIARVTCTNVDTTWTVDGKIFVKRKSDGRRFHVANQFDFTKHELL